MGPYRKKITKRELSAVSSVTPPVMYHTLLAEHHTNGGPYRSRDHYIVFQNSHVYPEYVPHPHSNGWKADVDLCVHLRLCVCQ